MLSIFTTITPNPTETLRINYQTHKHPHSNHIRLIKYVTCTHLLLFYNIKKNFIQKYFKYESNFRKSNRKFKMIT